MQDLILELDNLRNATYRLKRFLNDVGLRPETVEEVMGETTLISAWVDIKDEVKEYLLSQAFRAIVDTEEFDIPEYKSRLIRILIDDDIIRVRKLHGDNFRVEADTWRLGEIDQYADAVARTKSEFALTPRKAGRIGKRPDWSNNYFRSVFWRKFLYQPAREGRDIMEVGQGKVKKKLLSENPKADISHLTNRNRTADLVQQYWETMRKRFAYMGSGAPFWEILEYGHSVYPGGRGGLPYPQIQPQHFIANTIAYANMRLREALGNTQNRMWDELQKELERWLQDAQSYTPGEILAEIKSNSRLYEFYVTKRGRIGFRLSR